MPFVLLTLIHWMAIYLVDSDILPLNNWWQMDNHKTLKGLGSDLFEPLACEQALPFGRAKQARENARARGLVGYLPSHIQLALMEWLLNRWIFYNIYQDSLMLSFRLK